MKIETIDEGPVPGIVDNSSKFQELDVETTLKITDKLDKTDKPSQVKMSIGLEYEIKTDNDDKVYYAMYIGQYLLTIKNDLTFQEFSDFYKKPYNSFKDYFDNYKKGKALEPVNFPEFNKDLNLAITAFKERIPDLLNS